jgi:hypothetical protein
MPGDVEERLDELIREIREKFHKDKFGAESGWKGEKKEANDVLIVAHGHILRAFAARWIGKKLEENPGLILEAGGVGTLRYVLLFFCFFLRVEFVMREEGRAGGCWPGLTNGVVMNIIVLTSRRYCWEARLWSMLWRRRGRRRSSDDRG